MTGASEKKALDKAVGGVNAKLEKAVGGEGQCLRKKICRSVIKGLCR